MTAQTRATARLRSLAIAHPVKLRHFLSKLGGTVVAERASNVSHYSESKGKELCAE